MCELFRHSRSERHLDTTSAVRFVEENAVFTIRHLFRPSSLSLLTLLWRVLLLSFSLATLPLQALHLGG